MKTKLLTLTLLLCLLLSACGKQEEPTSTNEPTNEPTSEVVEEVEPTPTSEPIEEVEPTPTSEPIEEVEPTTTPEVEEPTTEDEESEFYSDSYQWVFPESMDGFTDKFVYANDETWSFNCTHYIAKDGTEMNFTWEGPTDLGERASAGEKTLSLYGGNNYELQAWTYGLVDETRFAEDLEYSKDTWTSFAYAETPYVENGYYDIQTSDTIIEVIFEVANDTQKGYNYYIVDLNRETCYQFAYLENIDIYDDTRAMNVINSLDFWDYIP